jgi:hypothetical protein
MVPKLVSWKRTSVKGLQPGGDSLLHVGMLQVSCQSGASLEVHRDGDYRGTCINWLRCNGHEVIDHLPYSTLQFATDANKLSPPGYKQLTLISSMPGYKPRYFSRSNAVTLRHQKTSVNAQCSSEKTKHHLQSLTKNMQTNRWLFQSQVFVEHKWAFNSDTKVLNASVEAQCVASATPVPRTHQRQNKVSTNVFVTQFFLNSHVS